MHLHPAIILIFKSVLGKERRGGEGRAEKRRGEGGGGGERRGVKEKKRSRDKRRGGRRKKGEQKGRDINIQRKGLNQIELTE